MILDNINYFLLLMALSEKKSSWCLSRLNLCNIINFILGILLPCCLPRLLYIFRGIYISYLKWLKWKENSRDSRLQDSNVSSVTK